MVEKDCSVKISIVTVCFNSAKTIEQTIKSVINQSYKNIEYIIIDGGSTDGTLDVIKKYEQYISYWVSEPDKGIYDAMNKGIRIATGELIAFLNSDDWYSEDALQRVAATYKSSRGNIIYGDMSVVDPAGNEVECLCCAEIDFNKMLYETVVYHPSSFIETSILRKRPFNIRYKICSDDDLFIDLFLQGYEFVYAGKGSLTQFRIGGCSTTTPVECRKEVYNIGKKYLKYYKKKSIYLLIKNKLRNIRLYVFLLELQNNLGSCYKQKIKNALLKNKTKKIYVFGAGSVGRILAKLLNELEIDFGIADNNPELQNTIIEGRIVSPVSDFRNGNNIVFIANSGYSAGMVEQLESMGLERKHDYYDFQDWCKYLVLLKYNRMPI